MARDDWSREVAVTRADLDAGDWRTRDRSPVALAIARVLRPGTTLFVDVGREEYFLAHGSHRAWFGLPAEFLQHANRVQFEDSRDELTIKMRFPPWALPTERWAKKQVGP
jgi:hypothetical protein